MNLFFFVMLFLIIMIHNYIEDMEKKEIRIKVRLPQILKVKNKIKQPNRYDNFEREKSSSTKLAIDKLFSQDTKNALIDYVNINMDDTNVKTKDMIQSYNDYNSTYYSFN
jgi:hypothetical protein